MILPTLRMAVGLIIVLVLALLILRYLYADKMRSGLRDRDSIQIVGRKRLSSRSELICVRCLGQDVLIGLSGNEMRILAKKHSQSDTRNNSEPQMISEGVRV